MYHHPEAINVGEKKREEESEQKWASKSVKQSSGSQSLIPTAFDKELSQGNSNDY